MKKVEKGVQKISTPLTVAIMGCVVNGPGEAKEADIGIAGGKGVGVLFKKGRVIRKVKEKDFASVLLREVQAMKIDFKHEIEARIRSKHDVKSSSLTKCMDLEGGFRYSDFV